MQVFFGLDLYNLLDKVLSVKKNKILRKSLVWK